MRFLSEENLFAHKEHIRTKRLKYSILEKSIPTLKSKSIKEIFSSGMNLKDKRDALCLLSEITLHDVFFESFSDKQYPPSQQVKNKFGAHGTFLNELYKSAMSVEYGFIIVVLAGRDFRIYTAKDYPSVFSIGVPLLCVDVCEHAYFLDYGFDKEKYLVNALSYLKIDIIDEILGQN